MNRELGKDILHTKQFSKRCLEKIFVKAQEMEEILDNKKACKMLEGKILASLFYEPSTRTRLSFESAMKRLGGEVITVNGLEKSSFKKGETIEDNAKMIENYADIIVMRHPESYSVEQTAENTQIPVINAGDGSHQHPTQGLLDVYTILRESGRLENLKIVICGDLKYSRTIHSLVFLMGLYKGNSFVFISPEELKIPKKIKSFLEEKNITYSETQNYSEGIVGGDVLYTNRIQQERFPDNSEYLAVKDMFVLSKRVLENNKKIIILNPLPRVNEILTEVDDLPNAAYFRQAKNGVPIRMALLLMLLADE